MYTHDSPHHRIHVTDEDGVRILRFERNHQSSMHLDDPFETDFDYPGYLHLTIAVKPDPARALVIGLGGGSVVKRMWRDYPGLHLDAIELDDEVIDVAYAFFALPEDDRIACFADDGRAFVRMSSEIYDVIIIDAFDDDRVPRPLLTEEFMRECRDRLSPDGVVAWNLIGNVDGPHSRTFRALYRTARNVWGNVWAFPIGDGLDAVDGVRNIILLATDEPLTEEALLDRIASRVDGRVTVPGFERFGDDLHRGPIRTGDVALLADPPPAGARRRRR
ncbi:MAG: fused MFS/spermidine synthase [Coriobacteriia bacterium]|nr:fused MFS/spermidine synthase [Coriobacteriia bacterium]